MEAGYRAGRQQRVDPRGWKFLGGGGVTPSPTPTIPPRGYYKVNLANREIDNIIAILDPNGGEEGAVKLYIPTSSIPQDTAQAVDVFYVDETGLVDSFSLIVPERAGTFLADLAAEAEPQVKAAYEGVNQVNSDTYLVDTAAKIRTDGVTPLPNVQPERKGLFLKVINGDKYIVDKNDALVLIKEDSSFIRALYVNTESPGTYDTVDYNEEEALQTYVADNNSFDCEIEYSQDGSVVIDSISYSFTFDDTESTYSVTPAPVEE